MAWDPKLGTAEGNRRRLRQQVGTSRSDDDATRRQAAAWLIETECAAGQHRPETDPDTGDEVCRYCRIVTDDYRDVIDHG